MAEWRRPDPRTVPAKAKAAGLYMICTLSKHAAERKGYADALMLDWRGQVAEATGANVFFVKDGKIHTPTPDCFLDGITRQTVIDLAKARGIEVIERAIMPEEMAGFEQCFLTGTAAEVTPVSEIGPYRFTVGAITKTLMDDYMAAVHPAAPAPAKKVAPRPLRHVPQLRNRPAQSQPGLPLLPPLSCAFERHVTLRRSDHAGS